MRLTTSLAALALAGSLAVAVLTATAGATASGKTTLPGCSVLISRSYVIDLLEITPANEKYLTLKQQGKPGLGSGCIYEGTPPRMLELLVATFAGWYAGAKHGRCPAWATIAARHVYDQLK